MAFFGDGGQKARLSSASVSQSPQAIEKRRTSCTGKLIGGLTLNVEE
jgi:hypothetical protein